MGKGEIIRKVIVNLNISHNIDLNLLIYTILFLHRRVWVADEDEAIRKLVTKFGIKSWSVIAENIVKEFAIAGRSGKQCRERWHNHLGKSNIIIT